MLQAGLLDLSSPNGQARAAEIDEGCSAMIDTLRGRIGGYEQADMAYYERRDTSHIVERIAAGDSNRVWSDAPGRL